MDEKLKELDELFFQVIEMNRLKDIPQDVLAIEECSEFIKERMKWRRYQTDFSIEEGCDVICSMLAYLRMKDVSYDKIYDHIKTKLRRALDRGH